MLFKVLLTVLFMLSVSITLGTTQVKVHESRFVRPLESLKRRVTDITSGKSTHEPEEPFSNPELAAIAADIEEMTETSSSLKEQLRSTDTIGRIGGEEFVILFPDTDLQTAYTVERSAVRQCLPLAGGGTAIRCRRNCAT